MMHFKQLLAYTLIFAVTNAEPDSAAMTAIIEEVLDILQNVEENKDDNFCCTPLNQIMAKNGITVPACNDTKDECEGMTCELQHKGLIKNNIIDEGKCKEQLDAALAKNPELKPIVEAIKEGCLDGMYKEYSSIECPAIQLYVCSYVVGSVACPKSSCDQAAVCKDTCDKYEQIKKKFFNE